MIIETDDGTTLNTHRKPFKIMQSKPRFVLRKRLGGWVVYDSQRGNVISFPIANKREAQKFCNKFVGTL